MSTDNVQNRLHCFLAFKICKFTRVPNSPYQPLLNLFYIVALPEKRKINHTYVKFLFKFVNFNGSQCRTKSRYYYLFLYIFT